MIDNKHCTFLGIYVMEIEQAGDTVGDVCEKHGIDEDEVWWRIVDEFEERLGIDSSRTHFANVVTDIIFYQLKHALKEKGIESDYYINGGLDTHFYIDGEEQ